MRKITAIIIGATIFASCEKVIDIDLNTANPQIIIEGNVTDQAGPHFVKITKTVNFSDENNYPPVTDALVIISDDSGIADTLIEKSPGLYQAETIIGQQGRTYNLTVSSEGKSYYATSTMPQKVILDTLIISSTSGPGERNIYSAVAVFTDPPQFGNNYRLKLTVNNKKNGAYNVFNDNGINGTVTWRNVFSRGAEIKLGDSVKIEMICIDESTYNYFYSLSQNSEGGFVGGTTPSNPPNNITGNKALGYFSAQTTQTRIQLVE
jgi:hypothetical protein